MFKNWTQGPAFALTPGHTGEKGAQRFMAPDLWHIDAHLEHTWAVELELEALPERIGFIINNVAPRRSWVRKTGLLKKPQHILSSVFPCNRVGEAMSSWKHAAGRVDMDL